MTALPLLGINGERRREDADIGADDTVVADFDLADVVDGAVTSDDNVVANLDADFTEGYRKLVDVESAGRFSTNFLRAWLI